MGKDLGEDKQGLVEHVTSGVLQCTDMFAACYIESQDSVKLIGVRAIHCFFALPSHICLVLSYNYAPLF